jgi:integrase
MAGQVRHIIERNGRFTARVVVPVRLRAILGKRELSQALGGDRRAAERQAHAVIAKFQIEIARAERQLELQSNGDRSRVIRRFSLAEIAHAHYGEELTIDDHERNFPEDRSDMSWSRPVRVAKLKQVAAGSLPSAEAAALIGWAVDKFAEREGREIVAGSPDWHKSARMLAQIELEIIERQSERDTGRFDGKPTHPILATAPESPEPAPVKLKTLFDGYFRELRAQNRGAEAERRWRPVFDDLRDFLKHDDALRITKQRLQDWKDDLIGRYAAKTIRDSYFGSVKAIFTWAADTGRIPSNPTVGLKIKVPKPILAREKGYNDDEAIAVLKAAADYKPKASDNPATTEQPALTAAKRWAPWLCAYTGARISEMTQLRKEDVKVKDGIHYLRITSDAGSVKTGQYRDVPIHPHLIERGFLGFVKASLSGPLFYRPSPRTTSATPWRTVSGRVSEWVRSLKVLDARVSPNHGWRDRFKTVAIEVGMNARACDAIQGHAARTAGENYGDVTIKARKIAVDLLPVFAIDQ